MRDGRRRPVGQEGEGRRSGRRRAAPSRYGARRLHVGPRGAASSALRGSGPGRPRPGFPAHRLRSSVREAPSASVLRLAAWPLRPREVPMTEGVRQPWVPSPSSRVCPPTSPRQQPSAGILRAGSFRQLRNAHDLRRPGEFLWPISLGHGGRAASFDQAPLRTPSFRVHRAPGEHGRTATDAAAPWSRVGPAPRRTPGPPRRPWAWTPARNSTSVVGDPGRGDVMNVVDARPEQSRCSPSSSFFRARSVPGELDPPSNRTSTARLVARASAQIVRSIDATAPGEDPGHPPPPPFRHRASPALVRRPRRGRRGSGPAFARAPGLARGDPPVSG